jgi:serine/threonine-protein kinase
MMAPPDDPLIEIAGTILDGRDVDWQAAESTIDDTDRALLSDLHALSDLAGFHRDGHDHAAVASRGVPWGSLELIESVGRGRYGEVFRAWDTRLHREVALKLLNQDVSRFDSADTSVAEGRLLARVRHPNVVAVYGAERIDGRIGIWTEFLRGRTLEALVAGQGPLDARETIEIGVEVCRALTAVHAAGLVHRDVKAQNIMREESGRIVLMDFGAGVELRSASAGLRDIAGTPLYLAPELVRGGRAGARSDVYSVGVLLFHLVTGQYPLAVGRSLDELDRAHRDGARRSLRECRADLPQRLSEVIDRALSPDPEHRFATAATLEQALAAALHDLDGTSRGEPTARWPFIMLTGAAVAASIAVVAGVILARRGGNNAPPGAFARSSSAVELTPTMRKVRVPAMGLRGGSPSFDGRFYVNTDTDENVVVVDLATGTSRKLTTTASANETAEFSVISPDGRSVAYAWTGRSGSYELQIIASMGGLPRRLLSSRNVIMPVEWSRDGRDLLVLLYDERGAARLSLVGVEDSRVRIVQAFRNALPQRASLSPDGRHVVFDLPTDGVGAGERDIFIESTDGGTAQVLVRHPANDVNPLWTPDGTHVLFVSDRSGTPDAWSIGVSNGVPNGEPELVARNVGRVALAGFTESGALYYWLQTGAMDVFTKPLDRRQPNAARVASRFVGSNSGPAYSPDGRYLAYLSQRTLLRNVPGAEVLVIRDLKLGIDREIVPDLRLSVVSPLWSPDGERLLLRGTDRQNRTGIFVFQVKDSALAPGVVVDLAHMSDIRQFGWWIDGRSIVYNSPAGVVVRDSSSGDEFRPFDSTHSLSGLRVAQFGLSPDRRSFAFSAVVEGTNPPARVVDVMTLDGAPRELARVVYPEQVFFQDWLPSGDAVLFTKRRADVSGPHALWRAPTDGQSPVETGISIPGFTQVNGVKVGPDGRTIAYTAGEASWELWVMEHFLPEPTR